jgi:hypothetical protein
LLPEIARLSLEGHSSRAIGRKLGVPRRTVDRWLRELRQRWAASAAENATELYAVAMARLESVYREAMEAWRLSLADKQVTVETPGEEGARKPKSSLRKTTQSGQAALLGKAIHAAGEISKFNVRHLDWARKAQAAQAAERASTRRGLADELRALSTKAFQELRDLVRQGGDPDPARSPRELAEMLRNMSAAEYRDFRATMWHEHLRELPLRRMDPRHVQGEVEADNGSQKDEE